MRTLFLPTSLGLAVALLACAPAQVDMPFDSDGDGMMDGDEVVEGTDPANPDSDEDGFLDGAEFVAGADPLNAEDHPYTGGWTIDRECRDGIASTGNGEGDITSDFDLTDQFGDKVSLYDFCGRVIILAAGAFW